MESRAPDPLRIRFGSFELDLRAGEVRQNGQNLKLHGQPIEVLAMLLEHPGEVVTREELKKKLWREDTFVDFDHSLNTAINKIREALGDTAENPKFVETIPRRGYRFIAAVETFQRNVSTTEIGAHGAGALTERGTVQGTRRVPLQWLIAGVGAFMVVVSAALIYWLTRPIQAPGVVRMVKLTNFGAVWAETPGQNDFPVVATDGTRVYFTEWLGAIREVAVTGGETSLVISTETSLGFTTTGDCRLAGISPDGTSLLILCGRQVAEGRELWAAPLPSGPARRVGDVRALSAAWAPDGRKIAYTRGSDLLAANADGSDPHKLATLPGSGYAVRFSPEGTRLRFTVVNPQDNSRSLWEVSAEGKDLHPLFPGWSKTGSECCGNWTPDGRYYLFQSSYGGTMNIWAVRERGWLFRRATGEPIQLTSGPLWFSVPVPSKDGRRVFVIGEEDLGETIEFHPGRKEVVPILSGTPVAWLDMSRDGQWAAYSRGGDEVLWRSKADGSGRLQLTSSPMRVWVPNWSPDGKRIAFMGKLPGKPWKIYVVSAEGGTPQRMMPGEENEADPRWSPDGNRLVFGKPPDYMAEPGSSRAISIYDLGTKQISKVPGSEGLFSPRWSPDGRYLAAMPLNQQKLMLFDFTTLEWKVVAVRHAMCPQWSPDGKYIYFTSRLEAPGIYRVGINDRKLERVVKREDIPRADVVNFEVVAVNEDGSLIVSLGLKRADIYALDWEAP